jgi:hypothetical protein
VKGTVKKHTVYRQIAQTELSRCVILPLENTERKA